jgi:flavin-binding protein dodecin
MLGFKAKDKHEDRHEDRHHEHGDNDRTGEASVVKVIEVIGTSDRSFDAAIAVAIETAASSLRNITGADVKHMTVAVKDGKISGYRVDLKVAFVLDADD